MDLYTLEEAKELIKYYSEKLIGKPIVPDMQSNVIRFDFVEYENGKFRVNCVGSDYGIIRPIHEISSVAKYYNLPTPKEILENAK
ncbi:hypothetical protein [uncultured Flavobacterium sp.]|uniref:hypothetical protein n=1 Tax=uncultured Flavobacterium sp. TaxID=165435 RepID=UPI0030C7FBFF